MGTTFLTRTAIALLIAGLLPVSAGVLLEPRKPADWDVSEWINGDPGRIGNHRGKVILLHFFQVDCPLSEAFATPLMRHWYDLYGKRSDVLMVSVHSPFEDRASQTPDDVRDYVRRHDLRHPVGIDNFDGDTPVTMERFGADGTPHLIVIDKEGKVVFSHLGSFRATSVEGFVARLLRGGSDERRPTPGRFPTMRGDRDAGESTPHPLSGRYTVALRTVDDSCGDRPGTRRIGAEVEVVAARLRMTFDDDALGFESVTLDYDGGLGTYYVDARRSDAGTGRLLATQLEIDGRFLGGEPPTLEFTAILNRGNPADENEQCRVELIGRGRRLEAVEDD